MAQAERQLMGPSKVAALLLGMNREMAGRVMKFFDEEEIKIVAQAAADLGAVPKETLDTLIEEFAQNLKSGVDLVATNQKIEALLEGVLSPDQIAAIMAATKTKSAHAVWTHLADIPEAQLSQYLAKEHPQVAALVLAKADAAMGAALLKQLPRDVGKQVVQRMLSLKHVSERPLVLLEISFLQDLLLNRGRDTGTSPHQRLAEVINKMERKVMDEVLNSLSEHSAKDADQIRQLLFTFDDLARLPQPGLVAVFDAVQPDITIRALYGVTPEFRAMVLEAIPARARRSIEVELTSGVTPKAKDVGKAQRQIADVALGLIERGVIEIISPEAEEEV